MAQSSLHPHKCDPPVHPSTGVILEDGAELAPAATDRPERQSRLWELLGSLLGQPMPPMIPSSRQQPRGSGAIGLHNVEDKGEYVHVFSHIR